MMTHLPLEQLQPTLTAKRRVTIGLPSAKAAGDSRFPITPEAAALIIGQGYDIKMEADYEPRGGSQMRHRGVSSGHERRRCPTA